MERELKKEEVGNIEKKGADFRRWNRPFFLPPHSYEILPSCYNFLKAVTKTRETWEYLSL